MVYLSDDITKSLLKIYSMHDDLVHKSWAKEAVTELLIGWVKNEMP